MQSARLRNFQVWFENSKEYHNLKREIFGEDIYYVELDKKNPVILDVGAHIGLSTLYFKMLYPESRITAVEPHPISVILLKQNIEQNHLEDVEVVQAAVGVKEGESSMYVDVDGEWLSSSSFSQGSWNNTQENVEIKVNVVKLGSLINRKIDLLKIDIEGAEEEVLKSLGNKLNSIKNILFEYHPQKNKSPEVIVEELEKYGFKVSFYKRGREVDWKRTKGLLIGEAIKK